MDDLSVCLSAGLSGSLSLSSAYLSFSIKNWLTYYTA